MQGTVLGGNVRVLAVDEMRGPADHRGEVGGGSTSSRFARSCDRKELAKLLSVY